MVLFLFDHIQSPVLQKETYTHAENKSKYMELVIPQMHKPVISVGANKFWGLKIYNPAAAQNLKFRPKELHICRVLGEEPMYFWNLGSCSYVQFCACPRKG